ncbi:MAG: urate oxidase [Streptosporangiales bacterium]|nr:urate oxidase [Streptosporangiales bacterium]
MDTVLASNRYGKAETRLVRIDRGDPQHEVVDLTVTTTLTGDFADAHLAGDNRNVLPTDSQKNTVYAFARDGVGSPEAFGTRLARHFVDTQPSVHTACVELAAHRWERVGPHSFTRAEGGETRTATVGYDGSVPTVTAGLTSLLLLNSTASEFTDFAVDEYTTLEPTTERVLATSVTARWRYGVDTVDYDTAHAIARAALVEAFADTYSLALQQTLYAMGERVLARIPEVTEVTLTLPNKHHFLVDLTPFGRDNPDAVYYAADRPYGLIEGTVARA